MAIDDLIRAYRAELEGRLPSEVVDELIDGLDETRDGLSRQGLAPDVAAAAAIADFGRPDVVLAAFARNSPGRRQAARLLATGPVFALLWGTALITSQAWTWPVPFALQITYGIALLAVVGALVAVLATKQPAKTRRAGYAAAALVLLDLAMIGAAMFAAPTLTWVMVPAVAASLIRITATTPNLPRILVPRPPGTRTAGH